MSRLESYVRMQRYAMRGISVVVGKCLHPLKSPTQAAGIKERKVEPRPQRAGLVRAHRTGVAPARKDRFPGDRVAAGFGATRFGSAARPVVCGGQTLRAARDERGASGEFKKPGSLERVAGAVSGARQLQPWCDRVLPNEVHEAPRMPGRPDCPFQEPRMSAGFNRTQFHEAGTSRPPQASIRGTGLRRRVEVEGRRRSRTVASGRAVAVDWIGITRGARHGMSRREDCVFPPFRNRRGCISGGPRANSSRARSSVTARTEM